MIDLTIPVLNEEDTLEQNVLKSLDYIKTNVTKDIRIIIVDNGSTDKTQYIGEKLENEYNEITFLKVPRKGVGLALRTSWISSEADVVGYMDLDLATDLKHLKEVYNILIRESEFEIVNGSRLLKDSKVFNRTFVRSVSSIVFNKLVQNLLGVKLSDGMCGFKFFKRERAVQLINTGIKIDGWFFSTEILVKALWANVAVKEIAVNWVDDKNSKVNLKKLSKEYFSEILRLRKEKSSFKMEARF